uniref:Methyltransferase type 11 n=1 Tax=Cyanothece sp. (strain PCC 7425 / ATCC 29141) TaxID=395961 RepID=B8HYC7_CYAP4
MAEYIFSSSQHFSELERLQTLERAFDPATEQRLRSTGVTANWCCLEVGAGAGSITQWLAARVGPGGKVTAVDLDTRFIQTLTLPNVEIISGDVRQAAFAPGTFDLIHVRYVLIHIPDVEAVLTQLFSWLKPGGWLVLEEPDFGATRSTDSTTASGQSFDRVNQAVIQMFANRGLNHEFGVKLPGLLQKFDLELVSVDSDAHLANGGSRIAKLLKMSTQQLAQTYLETGKVTQVDLDHYGQLADDPLAWAIYYATVGVVAQKLQP